MVEADLYQTTKKLALWFDASLSTVSFDKIEKWMCIEKVHALKLARWLYRVGTEIKGF